MALSKAILNELSAGYKTPQELEGLYPQMLQHMVKRALETELQAHVGHERHGKSSGNPRNDKSRKTVQSAMGDLQIETQRDRDGTFEPQLLPKRQMRLAGMEEKILVLYAKGMTTRDIESALVDLYGVTISHSVIAQITDAVLDEARLWQTWPLEAIYPIVWLDGIVVKVQQNKQVVNKSAHVVLGVNLRGEKEVLGLWLAENEGAKFWLSVLTELRQRGVRDVYIASMDGLKGLPEAVNAVFPKTLTQLCIVHMVRASPRYVMSTDREAVVEALPDATNARGTDLDSRQSELVGDELCALGRVQQVEVEDGLLDLGRDAVGMRVAWPAALLDQGIEAAHLVGAADLVEQVAVVAHELTGLGHVAKGLGEMEQGFLAFDSVRCGGHLVSPVVGTVW